MTWSDLLRDRRGSAPVGHPARCSPLRPGGRRRRPNPGGGGCRGVTRGAPRAPAPGWASPPSATCSRACGRRPPEHWTFDLTRRGCDVASACENAANPLARSGVCRSGGLLPASTAGESPASGGLLRGRSLQLQWLDDPRRDRPTGGASRWAGIRADHERRGRSDRLTARRRRQYGLPRRTRCLLDVAGRRAGLEGGDRRDPPATEPLTRRSTARRWRRFGAVQPS